MELLYFNTISATSPISEGLIINVEALKYPQIYFDMKLKWSFLSVIDTLLISRTEIVGFEDFELM